MTPGEKEPKFDLNRKGDESWPALFGHQWKEIFRVAGGGGLEAATPLIRVLAVFCRGYMTPTEKTFCDDRFLGARNGPDPFEQLEEVLDVLVQVAIRKGAWDFVETKKRIVEEVASFGSALR